MNEARDLNWRTTAQSGVSEPNQDKKTKNTNAQNADKESCEKE